MANEDSLKDQGDIPAQTLYDPRGIPRGMGYRAPPAPVQGAPVAPQAPPTGITQQAVVTSDSRVILPVDLNRQFLLIQNNDPVGAIWVAFGTDATNNLGIKLNSGGGAILFDNHVPTAAVSAIGDIAANPFILIITG